MTMTEKDLVERMLTPQDAVEHHVAINEAAALIRSLRAQVAELRSSSTESCWLIERADPAHPNHSLLGQFLGVVGSYDGHYGSGTLQWVPDANNALRFARHKDAAMFVGMMAVLQENMLLRDTIKGLRDGEPRALVIEHSWTDHSTNHPRTPAAIIEQCAKIVKELSDEMTPGHDVHHSLEIAQDRIRALLEEKKS
jgi:hypothetical protein